MSIEDGTMNEECIIEFLKESYEKIFNKIAPGSNENLLNVSTGNNTILYLYLFQAIRKKYDVKIERDVANSTCEIMTFSGIAHLINERMATEGKFPKEF